MGIGFSVSISRYSILIVAQSILNIALALWLYNEYIHNPFMQSYLSTAWSAIWPEVTIAISAATATLLAIAYQRGVFSRTANSTLAQGVETADNLATIDVCPFCDTPLKTIREGRLQCRNCRRYFKSSLPKMTT